MAIVVHKYGGSSVADPEKILRVAERIVRAKRAGLDVVVVVSAMGKTTDRLLEQAKAIHPEPPKRELDMLLSCGERIAMAYLAMAVERAGVPAVSLTGSQSGIITNDSHTQARILQVRPDRIRDELEKGHVVIVAGFQGMSYKREVTTLGRGGSDTTAVALAAALQAAACEICSDVDGVYTADPRVVPDARHLNEITYDEMEALARAGAKVLHAEAIAWARAHNLRVFATATFGRDDVGTFVVREAERAADGAAVGVTGRRREPRVRWAGDFTGFERLAALLGEAGLGAVDAEVRSQGAGVAFSARFAPEDAHHWSRFVAAAREALGPAVETGDDDGAVTLVGQGLTDDAARVAAVPAALLAAGVLHPGDRWDLETAPHRITIHLPGDRVDAAVKCLHDRFIGTGAARAPENAAGV